MRKCFKCNLLLPPTSSPSILPVASVTIRARELQSGTARDSSAIRRVGHKQFNTDKLVQTGSSVSLGAVRQLLDVQLSDQSTGQH